MFFEHFYWYLGSIILYNTSGDRRRRRVATSRARDRVYCVIVFPATAAAVVTVQAAGTPPIWRAR